MKVVITGAAGFLGSRLAALLLSKESPLPVTSLVLVDTTSPPAPADPRVSSLALDLTAEDAASKLIQPDTAVFFHLAAIVSGHAEQDFDLGFRVNFDVTRALLEEARRNNPTLKLVFTSTAAVFGGDLPPIVNDGTALKPQTSYGTAKAMSELLVNEYGRRGWVDARIVRLPTVTVRAGAANRAVTSFMSGIVREPLAGVPAPCPVEPHVALWVASPRSVVANIAYAATLATGSLGSWRVVQLPGLRVVVGEAVEALRRVAGENVASLVRWEPDSAISRMVESFPAEFDNERALCLGFTVDSDFEDIIRTYIRDDLKRALP